MKNRLSGSDSKISKLKKTDNSYSFNFTYHNDTPRYSTHRIADQLSRRTIGSNGHFKSGGRYEKSQKCGHHYQQLIDFTTSRDNISSRSFFIIKWIRQTKTFLGELLYEWNISFLGSFKHSSCTQQSLIGLQLISNYYLYLSDQKSNS